MIEYSVRFFPLNKKAAVHQGATVLEAAAAAGIVFNNLCAGQGICGRCKMILKKGGVSGNYQIGLDVGEINNNTILACLACVESDLDVEIPPGTLAFMRKRGPESILQQDRVQPAATRFASARAVEAELSLQEYSPLIHSIRLEPPQPTLVNNLSDQQRIENALIKEQQLPGVSWDLGILKILPGILRKAHTELSCIYSEYENTFKILDLAKSNSQKALYVVVVDVGTTALKARALRLEQGSAGVAGTAACLNSQGLYGRDVTSRIMAAEKKGSAVLQELIVQDINTLIGRLFENNAGRACQEAMALVCSGNTVMTHLLLGLSAAQIRRSPYVPVTVKPPPVSASGLGIKIHPRGLVYCVPGISGWVGGDISAGILATGMYSSSELCLLVDIGTNGEIVLGSKDWLVSCSASAGPALEGAGQNCGMQAMDGAVEKVWADQGELRFRTIGGRPAVGICGSGLIDLVSVMLDLGIIDRCGRFSSAMKPVYRKRLQSIRGRKSFVLCSGKNAGTEVYITEPDIEHIISAKAAIFAAVSILVRRFDLEFTDIKHLFLAGSFGNCLDTRSAVNIGLIPAVRPEVVHFVGNTSLQGATLAALSREARLTLTQITHNTTYFDLMGEHDYVEEYKKALFLPHTDLELFA